MSNRIDFGALLPRMRIEEDSGEVADLSSETVSGLANSALRHGFGFDAKGFGMAIQQAVGLEDRLEEMLGDPRVMLLCGRRDTDFHVLKLA